MVDVRIGERIKAYRERRGLKLKELVEPLNLSGTSSITNWESNLSKPDLDRFLTLCMELDVSPNTLLGVTKWDAEYSEESDAELLRWYHALDSRGQDEVLACIKTHLERCGYYRHGGEEITALFIGVDNPNYSRIRESCKELRKLQRRNRISYEDIFHYLSRISPYCELHLCLAYVIQIMHGSRCPSEPLYTELRAFLSSETKKNKKKT